MEAPRPRTRATSKNKKKKATKKKPATGKAATPEKAAPKQTTFEKAVALKTTPQKTTPQKTTPQETTPRKTTPKRTSPRSTPKRTSPRRKSSPDVATTWTQLTTSDLARKEARDAELEAKHREMERLEEIRDQEQDKKRRASQERSAQVQKVTQEVLQDDVDNGDVLDCSKLDDDSSDEENAMPAIEGAVPVPEADLTVDSDTSVALVAAANVERQGIGSHEAGGSKGPPDATQSKLSVIWPKSNCSEMFLLLWAFGLKSEDGSRYLADFVNDPVYSEMPKKSQSIPTVAVMKKEMDIRAAERGMPELRMSAALRQPCLAWLREHPRTDIHDIAFLRREEQLTYDAYKQVRDEKEQEAQDKLDRSNWNTDAPWMRLYHCLSHDDVMVSLAEHGKVMNRQELQNRNDEESPIKPYWEAVRDVYNDDTIVFESMVDPSLHPKFANSMSLKFSDMPGGELSTQDVKRKIGDAKAKCQQVRTLIKKY